MATPNVTIDIADFLSGAAPASKVGYPVMLTPVTFSAPNVRQALTDSNGQATLSAVVPGNYDLQILGLGIENRRVTVTDEAGPLDAADLAEADTGGRVPTSDNPLIAGENITITQKTNGLEIASSGGGGEGTATGDVAFTDTDGALSIEASAASGGDQVTIDTDAAKTDGNLLVLKNNAGEKLAIGFNGFLSVGGITANSLYSFNSTAEDENGQYVEATDGADYAYFQTDLTATSAETVLGAADDSVVDMFAGTGYSGMQLKIAGTARTELRPYAADAATAYNFDTSVEHTSGNLLTVKNAGTSKFAVNFAGRFVTPSAPPAAADSTGVAGSWAWDTGFIYICTATNTWKRVAIATWP